MVVQIVGIIAGVVGGWIVGQLLGPSPDPWRAADRVTATVIGAVLLSRFVTDIYGLATRGSAAQR
jgi:hypothetical protein